jgi:guanylate kinase
MNQRGLLVAIVAASGTGKTTLCNELLRTNESFTCSISYTTRKPRDGEIDGTHYHFVEQEKFLQMKESQEFAEWAEVHSNYYGTSKQVIESSLANGQDLLFDIDYQGAFALKKSYPSEIILVFLLPPSMEELEHRLRSRGTDSDDVIEQRLANSRKEISQSKYFDYIIVNDTLDEAVKIAQTIIDGHRHASVLTWPKAKQLLD